MTDMPEPSPANQTDAPSLAQRLRNFIIVGVATTLAVLLAIGVQQHSQQPSLSVLAQSATHLDTALTNGKPSVVEFYANWCSSCQAMVDDVAQLETEFSDRVNFVMLNVDNDKWLPEILRYRVDGIPHFVFLDAAGEPVGSAIGEQPRPMLQANLTALVAAAPLTEQDAGDQSVLQSRAVAQSDDPRSHGGQPGTLQAS